MSKENKAKQSTENEEIVDNNANNTETENTVTEECSEDSTNENPVNMAVELATWQDKYARLSADFDNFRKRTLKEKMDLIESAGADTIKSILPILDDMTRAVEANKSSEDIEAVRTGMELIYKKLYDMLTSKGVSEIECMNCELDTDLHEAIAKFPVEEQDKKGKIIDVLERGYRHKDRVIRFAKVVVGE